MPTAKKRNYKQKQQIVDFGTSVSRFWTKYVDFNGTAQRSEYWFVVLFCFLVNLPIELISVVSYETGVVFNVLWTLATLIPWLALCTRRFHDAGFSAKWLWVPLVSMFGGVLFGIMLAAIAESSYNQEVFYMLASFLGIGIAFASVGFSIFWFVISLMPSKFEDNKYRK